MCFTDSSQDMLFNLASNVQQTLKKKNSNQTCFDIKVFARHYVKSRFDLITLFTEYFHQTWKEKEKELSFFFFLSMKSLKFFKSLISQKCSLISTCFFIFLLTFLQRLWNQNVSTLIKAEIILVNLFFIIF